MNNRYQHLRQYHDYSIIFSWKLMEVKFVLEINDEFSEDNANVVTFVKEKHGRFS